MTEGRPLAAALLVRVEEFVAEYLEMHQAAPATMAELRWLLGKATAVLNEEQLADLILTTPQSVP